jgi:hypothetical protein
MEASILLGVRGRQWPVRAPHRHTTASGIEAFWQMGALSLVGDSRGTPDGHDHPPGCPRPFNEELPGLLSGDVVGHHVVTAR